MNKMDKLKYHELADLLKKVLLLTNEIKEKMSYVERQMFEDVLADKGIRGNCFDWKQENIWYISQLLRNMAPLEEEEITKKGFNNNEAYK